MAKQDAVPYKTFLYWLLMASLILSFLLLLRDTGVLLDILRQDSTRISSIILAIFCLTCLHCAWRSLFLARQDAMLVRLKGLSGSVLTVFPEGQSLLQDYLNALHQRESDQDKALLAEVLAESVRGSHQVGWFIAGLLVKLGLLGTVIGFVLMLGSVSELENLDLSDIKQLMQQMTQGMGIAMNTTMMGLGASMLLGLQYLLLDRCADRLIITGIELGQAVVIPPAPEDLKEITSPVISDNTRTEGDASESDCKARRE